MSTEEQPLDLYGHVDDLWDRMHLRNGYADGYDQAISDLEDLRQGRNRGSGAEVSFDEQQRGIALAIAHLRANASVSAAPMTPEDASSYFDVVRTLTRDPDLLAVVDKVEAEWNAERANDAGVVSGA